MLAEIRKIQIGSTLVSKTPVLVPSFSSKGFPEVEKIVETLAQTITESTLLSAYDIAHGHIKSTPTFPSFFFLDSGGYECSRDVELSDNRKNNYVETPWTQKQLEEVLNYWNPPQPTIAISYDHPKHRTSVGEQIRAARDLLANRNFGREILIKPITVDSGRVDMPSVLASLRDCSDFDVIGFTEKELGYSLFKRMQNISAIRRALTDAGLNTPIHIFGSLDTVSTPLYFLSGADIFDGLTWLRYAYVDDQAIYSKNLAALSWGIHMNDQSIDPRIWAQNYQVLATLQSRMKRFVKDQNYEVFGARLGAFFKDAIQNLEAED